MAIAHFPSVLLSWFRDGLRFFGALLALSGLAACTPYWQEPIPADQIELKPRANRSAGAVWGSPLADEADENEFPREIALEAILRFIEEDLESGAAVTASP